MKRENSLCKFAQRTMTVCLVLALLMPVSVFAAPTGGTAGITFMSEPAAVDSTETAPAPIEIQATPAGRPESILVMPTANVVLVDGEAIYFRGFNIGDANFFMLRDIAYTLNGSPFQFEVIWDDELRAINLLTGYEYTPIGGEMAPPMDTPGSAWPNLSSIYADGRSVDVRSYNIGGNNFFMLRDLGEVLGFGVDWDEESASILISTEV